MAFSKASKFDDSEPSFSFKNLEDKVDSELSLDLFEASLFAFMLLKLIKFATSDFFSKADFSVFFFCVSKSYPHA